MGERVKFQSPRGEVLEASLHETVFYKGKDTGNYVCKLVLTGDALETVKAQVEEFLIDTYGTAKAKYAKRPFKNTDDGSKTFITFKAKVELQGVPRVIGIFDSRGKLVTQRLDIAAGSIIKVNGAMTSWEDEPGVSFYMEAVQVIQYVEGRRGSFDPDDSDGGFVAK